MAAIEFTDDGPSTGPSRLTASRTAAVLRLTSPLRAAAGEAGRAERFISATRSQKILARYRQRSQASWGAKLGCRGGSAPRPSRYAAASGIPVGELIRGEVRGAAPRTQSQPRPGQSLVPAAECFWLAVIGCRATHIQLKHPFSRVAAAVGERNRCLPRSRPLKGPQKGWTTDLPRHGRLGGCLAS